MAACPFQNLPPPLDNNHPPSPARPRLRSLTWTTRPSCWRCATSAWCGACPRSGRRWRRRATAHPRRCVLLLPPGAGGGGSWRMGGCSRRPTHLSPPAPAPACLAALADRHPARGPRPPALQVANSSEDERQKKMARKRKKMRGGGWQGAPAGGGVPQGPRLPARAHAALSWIAVSAMPQLLGWPVGSASQQDHEPPKPAAAMAALTGVKG
jgi:hypothetical protein